MVPLQAIATKISDRLPPSDTLRGAIIESCRRTELLLDDFEDLLLIKFLGKTLDSRQGLTTITLCK